jgi:hypothetical protein
MLPARTQIKQNEPRSIERGSLFGIHQFNTGNAALIGIKMVNIMTFLKAFDFGSGIELCLRFVSHGDEKP